MKISLVIFFTFFLVSKRCCFRLEDLVPVPQDTFRNVSELITSKGYPVEEFTVQTPDGYLISVQRIPHGKSGSTRGNKPVVFLLHGFLSDSSQWVFNNETQSLAFVLADSGYDVWLGNTRGNTYARRNVRLSPSQNEFWDFSFEEMAKYDVPSMIDFALAKTGQNQLSYVGHSQGTTIAFALLSQSPYYNEKIIFFIALAPITHSIKLGGLLGLLAPIFVSIQPFYKDIGFVEVLSHTRLIELFAIFVCGTPLRFICADLIFGLSGTDKRELNYTRLPVYVNNIPAGISTKDFIHYSQLKFSGKFRKYDYYNRNQEVYNQPTPPEYDISKITTPVALLSAANDLVADPFDVSITQSNLKSLVDSYVVPLRAFNHFDFVIAIDAYPLINRKVLSLLEKFGRN